MHEIKAKLSYLRIAPRKVRMVADMIRGKKALEALALLSFNANKASIPMKKLLNSAIANAKNNFDIADPSQLYISIIQVDEGPKLKRWRARSRGRAFRIEKKTSHIALVLSENPVIKKEKKRPMVEKAEKPVQDKTLGGKLKIARSAKKDKNQTSFAPSESEKNKKEVKQPKKDKTEKKLKTKKGSEKAAKSVKNKKA